MQLDLAPAAAPRVLALCVPDVALQRLARDGDAAAAVAVLAEGRVVACSPAARAAGVRIGDSGVQAEAVCAGIALVAHDAAADRAALEALAEALLALGPAVEIAPPDSVLVDASAARLVAGGGGATDAEARLAARAVEVAEALGFRARAAVASGRGPARALARCGGAAAPVPAAARAAAPARLPLRALELPDAVAARLRAVGVADAGAFARLPAAAIGQRFGAGGVAAWRLARGEDPSRLAPWAPSRLPSERIDLEAPVESAEALLFALKRLCDRVAARLAGRGLGATRLGLALALDPAGAERLVIALAAPSASASRWLVVLRERVGALRLPGAVVAVALEVDEAAEAPAEQLALGERSDRVAALDAVLARLAARLGPGAAFAAEPVERHRPEAAYRAAPFRAREAGACDGRAARTVEAAEAPRPTRLLEAPLPLVAEGEGGRVTAVRVDGRAFAVASLSPPERLAGEWWSEPIDRDYHRALLEGLGECWIYRDGADGRLWLHGFFD
jgi:protein ImuB